MKIKSFILVSILVIGYHFCIGQNETDKKQITTFDPNSTVTDAQFYVLKVGDQSLEIYNKKDKSFDLESIDSKWIKQIEILKGDDAEIKYGKKAQKGVIIIMFKDFNILSEELQSRFNEIK